MVLPLPTIAIIGHGRSPEGRGWGAKIDAADVVVRMWNWHWQDAADYGTRFDWGMLEVHKNILRDFRKHNRHEPARGWIASLLMRYRDMANDMPADTLLIDQASYMMQLRRQDRGVGETGVWELTRGGIAACWAISTAPANSEIVLVGFDVIKAGIAPKPEEAFAPVYVNSPGFFGMGAFKEGQTKEGNHDYPCERNLLQFLADRCAVKLHFAQDVWP